jgi:outer membrane lipoprotein-sorting protein
MTQDYNQTLLLAKVLLGGCLLLPGTSLYAADAKAKAEMQVPLVKLDKVSSPHSRVMNTQAVAQPSGMPQTPAGQAAGEAQSAAELAVAAQTVEKYFNGISTLKANFTQKVTGEPFTSEGTFVWKKPKQFVWTYETPNRQRVISTGAAVYYSDDERHQVTQLPNNAGLARIFNAGRLNLAKSGLRVAAVQNEAHTYAVTLQVVGDDTREAAAVKSLRIAFIRGVKGLTLASMEAIDLTGAVTRIGLNQVQTNVPVDAKVFAFTPGVYKQKNEAF